MPKNRTLYKHPGTSYTHQPYERKPMTSKLTTTQQQLCEQHYNIVEIIAKKMIRNYPNHIELDDLISWGTTGLIEAATRYNPETGNKFTTYATPRIKGAILDELRRTDPAPRSLRERQKQIEQAINELSRTGTTPTETQLAEHLGWTTREIQTTLDDIHLAPIGHLDMPVGTVDNETTTIGELYSNNEDAYQAATQFMELANKINLDVLADRERVAFTLFYYESLTLAEIGRILSVTESRVSQIHTQAVTKLLHTLTGRDSTTLTEGTA